MDERQFSQRVRACEQKLYNTARMLLPCQADCEDAVQEALFKAWARLDSLRDTGRFEAWLMRILINECKMLLRRRRAHRESALTGAEEDFRMPDAPPGAEEMRAALRALEEKYRLPLLLHLAEGFEVVDVARMLRLSQGAATVARRTGTGGADMNRKDNWQALLMPVSEGFHNRVEETLEQIGKEAKSLQGHRKRTRALRSLAVALVAALLLAGTALAVGRLAGILDFASPRVEDETARQYIEHNLATAQNGRIRLTVREGYYDGEVARTILEIAPVRMEDSIVLHDWWHYPNGEEFFAPGETDWQEGSAHSIAPSLEKAALPPGTDGAIAVVGESKNYTEDKAEDLTNCRATAVREGNAVVLYIEGSIHSYVGEVDLGYSVYTENGETVSVRFTLKEEGVENVPMEFVAVEFYGLALQKVCVQYTPFAAFLQVAYAPALSGEAVAESGAYDPAGIYYGTEGGHYGHAVPDCQGMANATEWTGQELLDMCRPPCPVCVVPDSTKDKNSFLAQYGWTFDLLAADGQSLLDADSPWTRYNNASLYGQPEEWSTVSLPLRPDASLGGALSLEPYLAEDDIAIEAPRIPCWLAETALVG